HPSAMTARTNGKMGMRQQAEDPAAMLAIGTTNPTNLLQPQDVFAEKLFRVTKSDHLTELKEKLKRISRIDMVATDMPKLAQSAAAKAIAEWGRPATDITHLVFSTYSALQAPSADLKLATLLSLRTTVCRTILSLHGCYGGARALHLAKELAENNRGARVLVACAETTLICFGSPNRANLVGHALFGDGAGAVIVGAGPFSEGERPLFEMVTTTQNTIPWTEHVISMQATAGGIDFHLAIQVPMLIGQNVERCLLDAFDGDAPASWNELFWAVHPGGRPILDNIDTVLKLEPGKLAASRRVLREYGNMSGATIFFVLDELRRRRKKEEDSGHLLLPEWGARPSGRESPSRPCCFALHANPCR
uniref:Chalcone synthase n=1 Tax=Aegilops tauschii subsp. strangulata TaxID=200361 RepID=A0A453AAE4_AEGTS